MNFAACPFSLPPLFSTGNNSIALRPHCPIPPSPILPRPDGLQPIPQPLAFGSGESKAQGGGAQSGAFDQRVKKRDELGLRERGRLVAGQKQVVVEWVEAHRGEGGSVREVLGNVGVARSSYYRWKKGEGEKKDKRQSSYELTVEERQMIEGVKEAHPEYRHRRIQGVLQQQG